LALRLPRFGQKRVREAQTGTTFGLSCLEVFKPLRSSLTRRMSQTQAGAVVGWLLSSRISQYFIFQETDEVINGSSVTRWQHRRR
jgi:hypothetical protein